MILFLLLTHQGNVDNSPNKYRLALAEFHDEEEEESDAKDHVLPGTGAAR